MYKNLLKSKNYINFLEENTNLTRLKKIQIGYELQAGSYEKAYNYNELMQKRVKILKNTIIEILKTKERCKIIEVGIGEGNTMRHLVENLDEKVLNRIDLYGIELSFSRIKITKKHLPNSNLYVSDMKYLPFSENSFDIVYTSSAIEPNINNENDILQELYRISSNYLILFEISYREANDKLKERFDKHKYVKNIYESIKELDYNLLDYYKLMESDTYNNFLFKIQKLNSIDNNFKLISPLFGDEIKLVNYNNQIFYKSDDLNLYFPIIDNIPILLIENSIIIK